MASSTIFITAAEARQNPLRERAVHDEARGIESAILDAVKLGLYEATVSDGTPMTTSTMAASEVWTIDPATDQIYIPNHGFGNGDAVTVSSTIALPAPLRSTSYYYVIYVDPDHIKLAATYADAVSGRPISIDVTAGVTSVIVSNGGSGYIQPPVVTITGGGATVNASARANLADYGGIVGIYNSTSGSGYTDTPTVQIVPQGSGATVDSIEYKLVGITINDPGMDYHVNDILTILGGTGTSATARVVSVDGSGAIQLISLSNAGSYTALPSLVGAATTVLPGGGSGATVNLTVGIGAINIDAGGTGYTAPPRIIIEDPSGVGAQAQASVTGGSVTGVTVTNPGYGYVGVSGVSFDSGSGASAVVSLTPSGVSSVTVTNGGSGYRLAPVVSLVPVGTGAAAGTVRMKVVSAQMTSAGSGYQVDDMLLVAGGTATENAVIRVTSVAPGGIISNYVIDSPGSYTGLPGLSSNPVNGGSGILAAFNLVMGVGSVDVSSTGSGYVVPPVVSVSQPPASGTQATVNAVVLAGEVIEYSVTNPGYGYVAIPTVTVSNGEGATAEAFITGTTVESINVDSIGDGYSYANVEITGGGATINATAVATVVGGTVSVIDVIDPGEGYTSEPTITITGDGFGATASAVLAETSISSISILENGSGYNIPPSVVIPGNAEASSVLLSTTIDRIVVTSQGENYTADPTVYLIPGPQQASVPTSPVMGAQRGFSIATISVVNGGENYESAPAVSIAAPQIIGGTQATADAYIGAGSGTFALRPYPSSMDYYKAWKGQQLSNNLLSRPYIERMDTIISYFKGLGYTIDRLTNPSTNSTISWKIQW